MSPLMRKRLRNIGTRSSSSPGRIMRPVGTNRPSAARNDLLITLDCAADGVEHHVAAPRRRIGPDIFEHFRFANRASLSSSFAGGRYSRASRVAGPSHQLPCAAAGPVNGVNATAAMIASVADTDQHEQTLHREPAALGRAERREFPKASFRLPEGLCSEPSLDGSMSYAATPPHRRPYHITLKKAKQIREISTPPVMAKR